MEATVAKTGTEGKTWGGGNRPLNASYGKMMMWFFIVSDALTFSGFIASYGFSRFKFIDAWPVADEVFTHVPFLHGVPAPMYYVAFMTLVLIFSSVTMVLAVDAGHKMQKKKVIWYMFFTIIGGAIFVGSQAWEWATFIKGDYGAVETKGGKILQFLNTEGERVAIADFAKHIPTERVTHEKKNGVWYAAEPTRTSFSYEEVKAGFLANDNLLVRTQYLDEHGHPTVLSREESVAKIMNDGKLVVEGANLRHNEYGHPLFANFFFFITGFHGFHVFSGVIINIIIFFNVILGTYEKRKSYEMVEKVGLYWHFVDLVWVFVFTFFYLV
ncbi:cytochrome c oxidase subunit 3 [Aureisphaera sp. CAU 1614]|jgi:cytochrome c oxidase subunit 3|uniref:Cytochrome c oxidase subunit 3 n=1 Tax=Halomarinibacterium sedimenti TaxID=2857106 RepID=A0A9X1JW37_9FLAO|nr:cytochrome c oxidase subunit 3 [Halomarinibacterium sedimenti]MAL59969.1 cytochrome oxidase subunit III [Flavobacteriaceae bacterium]MBW2938644.1 cytochrome c oxidase subunit 3 [Halomarinibacterium sedimenti]|tara:strand:- start:13274 stop:14254 length:981 start_codon:yes stop_codon:yes gene_type:complete